MLKRIIATSLVATALMFSGCGETDQAGEDRLSAQTSIDSGNYTAAISLLEAKTNKTDSENLTLASAYMSRAGFSLTDIMVSVDAASSSDVTGDDLDKFKASVLNDLSVTALEDIEKAIVAYEAIDGVLVAAPALSPSKASSFDSTEIGLSDNQLKLGLAYIIKFAIMLNTGATDADLAVIANDAFNYIIGVAPTDLKSKVQAVKDDIDKDSSGVIDASELTMYR